MIESSPLLIALLILLTLGTSYFLWRSFRQPISIETPTSEDPDGNRRHQRFSSEWPITILTWRGTEHASTRNLSLGGMFVEIDPPLPLHKVYPMVLQGPADKKFFVRAKVIWTASNIPEGRGLGTGMGVQFVYLDSDALNFIADLERLSDIQSGPGEPPSYETDA